VRANNRGLPHLGGDSRTDERRNDLYAARVTLGQAAGDCVARGCSRNRIPAVTLYVRSLGNYWDRKLFSWLRETSPRNSSSPQTRRGFGMANLCLCGGHEQQAGHCSLVRINLR
jgi:hypothetical protein